MPFKALSIGKNKKFSLYGVGFLLVIIPLIYIPGIFNPYEFPKFIFFVAIAVFLFFLRSSKVRLLDDRLSILALSFLLIAFLADLIGLDPKISLLGSQYRHQGFITLLSGVLLFFTVRSFMKEQGISMYQIFERGILLGTFIICLISFWQAFSFYVMSDWRVPLYQGRIVGTFGNPNFLGGYLAMTMPFLLWGKERLSIKVILLFMSLLTVFLSGSRGAILAVGLILLIFVIPRLAKRRFLEQVFACIMGIILIYMTLQFYQIGFLGLNRDSFWDNRGIIWSQGAKAILARPILGYGQENFELVFPKERNMKVDNAHNIFLETAVSSGILGLLLFLAIIVTAVWQAGFVLKISIIAFLITAQFNPLSIAQISLFWFLLGLTSQNKPESSL